MNTYLSYKISEIQGIFLNIINHVIHLQTRFWIFALHSCYNSILLFLNICDYFAKKKYNFTCPFPLTNTQINTH